MNLIKKYKSCLPKIFILFFFILMFSFPYASYKGASSGLMLWFLNVLPTLLPFIIISNMMIKLNIAGRISHMLYPILGRLFSYKSQRILSHLDWLFIRTSYGSKINCRFGLLR